MRNYVDKKDITAECWLGVKAKEMIEHVLPESLVLAPKFSTNWKYNSADALFTLEILSTIRRRGLSNMKK